MSARVPATGRVVKPATLKGVREHLRSVASADDAVFLQRFFKTGPGEYGEGDVFIGVRVPAVRATARVFRELPVSRMLSLLHSRVHEERLLALIIMVNRFESGDQAARKELYAAYLDNTRHINNWDLVDLSAYHIVGAYLADRSRRPLQRLAQSADMWERRIAILSTYHFIRNGEYGETLRIAERLLGDEEDLIHKAVGWMLREVGNRDREIEVGFLRKHYRTMPRTMLRYAIERFPERERQRFLKGRV